MCIYLMIMVLKHGAVMILMLLLRAFLTSRSDSGKIVTRGWEVLVKDGELSLLFLLAELPVVHVSPSFLGVAYFLCIFRE